MSNAQKDNYQQKNLLGQRKIMIMKNNIITIFSFVLLFSSCVSMQKYKALEAAKQQLEIKERGVTNQLEREKAVLEEKEKEIVSLKAENNKLQDDLIQFSTAGGKDLKNYQKKIHEFNDSLNKQINLSKRLKASLEEQNNRLQNTIDSFEIAQKKQKNEIAELKLFWTKRIESLEDSIYKTQKILALAERENQYLQKIIDSTETQKKDLEKTINDLKNKIPANEQETMLSENEKKELGKELAFFVTSLEDSKVQFKNNQNNYIVEIREDLLFSESGKITTNGNETLEGIKNILKKFQKANVMVEVTGNNNEDRPLKAELVRKFLSEGSLQVSSSPKNFSTMAFNNAQELAKYTKIYIK
jgi:chromosome segregation ATPase